ncbi:MAG TPA: hypothetical protein VMV44_06645, partial [Rectinemataceae bacterium]|nr:hypothetical protein [Rectinemataceae bacterium]
PLAAMPRPTAAQGVDAEAARVKKAPDVSLSLAYSLPTSPEVLSALIRRPILFLRLWELYGFSPRYEAKALEGGIIHIVDPTGIEGEVFPAGGTGVERRYLAKGAINHRLAPPFRGTAVLDLSYAPDGNGTVFRVGLSIRMENRLVGFFVWTFFPLVRGLVVHRVDSNIADIGTIAADLAARPKETAGRLDTEDARLLLAELEIWPIGPH